MVHLATRNEPGDHYRPVIDDERLKHEVDAVDLVEALVTFLKPELSGRAPRELHHGEEAEL